MKKIDLSRRDAATKQLQDALDVANRALASKPPNVEQAHTAIQIAQSTLETLKRHVAEFEQEMMCLLFEVARDQGTLFGPAVAAAAPPAPDAATQTNTSTTNDAA